MKSKIYFLIRKITILSLEIFVLYNIQEAKAALTLIC